MEDQLDLLENEELFADDVAFPTASTAKSEQGEFNMVQNLLPADLGTFILLFLALLRPLGRPALLSLRVISEATCICVF